MWSRQVRSVHLRAALLALLVAAGVAVAVAGGVPSVEQVRSWVDGAGWTAPAVFAVIYAGVSLLPAPLGLLSVAGGVLFGLGAVLAGATAGALGAFGIARTLGRPAVVAVRGDRLARLDGLVGRHGVLAVIAVRLIPLLPFTALNYACGLTAVPLRAYAVGTVVGIIPGAAAYVAIGAYGADPGSVPFWLSVGGLAVLVVFGGLLARRTTRRERLEH